MRLVDGVPGDEDAEGREEAGEHDEPHREAVDAEVVADGGRGDPGEVLLELEGAGCGGVVEVDGQMQREQEGDERDGERAPLHESCRGRAASASRTAPASGAKVMRVRMVWSMFIVSFDGAKPVQSAANDAAS